MKNKSNEGAVVYARTAAGDEKEIAKQIRYLTRLVKRNGENLIEVYIDSGASGLTLNRPGFKKLVSDANRKKFTKLYTRDISRISRDFEQLEAARSNLNKNGVKVVLGDSVKKVLSKKSSKNRAKSVN